MVALRPCLGRAAGASQVASTKDKTCSFCACPAGQGPKDQEPHRDYGCTVLSLPPLHAFQFTTMHILPGASRVPRFSWGSYPGRLPKSFTSDDCLRSWQQAPEHRQLASAPKALHSLLTLQGFTANQGEQGFRVQAHLRWLKVSGIRVGCSASLSLPSTDRRPCLQDQVGLETPRCTEVVLAHVHRTPSPLARAIKRGAMWPPKHAETLNPQGQGSP